MADEEAPKKRASARPTWKDIHAAFEGHGHLLGLYSHILAMVSWGTHTTKLRTAHKSEAEQWVTTSRRIEKFMGKDRRSIKRELNILAAMGVITIERLDRFSLVISNTNVCSKSAVEAMAEIGKTARKSSWPKPANGHAPARHDELNGHAPAQLGDSNGHAPARRTGMRPLNPETERACARSTPIPSLLEKKKREEEIREEEREEEGPPAALSATGADKVLAKIWHDQILRRAPGSRITLDELEVMVTKCQAVMDSLGLDPGCLLDVLGHTLKQGSSLLRVLAFKTPKKLLEPDSVGQTYFEEMCSLWRDSTIRAKTKRGFY